MMDNRKKRVPDVRFKGFSDDWEQRKLGEVAEFNPKSALPDSFEYVDLESVVGTDLVNHRTEEKATAPSRAQRLAKRGDIFYQIVRPYQKNNCLFDLPYNNYVFSTGYAQMRPHTDSRFLFSRLQEERFVKAVLDRCTGTSYPAINANDLSEIEIKVPCDINEQVKIGMIFKSLDSFITLHQSKLSKLQQMKKGLIQAMLPKNGSLVPRLRFANFNEEWEQCKAIDIFKSVSDKNHPELPVLSASQEKGMVLRDSIGIDIKYDKKSLNTYKRVLPGQFVMHLRSFQGGFAYSSLEGITSPAYTVLDFKNRDKQSSIFWHFILSSENFIKRLETVTYGIRDGKSISYSDFSTLKFNVPSLAEQIRIGEILVSLDNIISIHQKKLDKLQEFKKAYLQKMFI